jgi:quercetin dioxygenase-like cupin family protein
MGRDHVEFVSQSELDWTEEPIAETLPPMHLKTLSIDEETGAFTRLVELPPGYESEEPVPTPTPQELYTLDGTATVGDHELAPHVYLRLPDDGAAGRLRSESGCRFLWMSDAGLDADGDDDGQRFWPLGETAPKRLDATEMEWQASPIPGPEPGLFLKTLHMHEESGAATMLARAEDWTEPRQEHHDCVETAYTLAGAMKLGRRGTMNPGDYFWRPPWIRHGPMESVGDDGEFVALMRVDGPLVNHYTSGEGAPVNY